MHGKRQTFLRTVQCVKDGVRKTYPDPHGVYMDYHPLDCAIGEIQSTMTEIGTRSKVLSG